MMQNVFSILFSIFFLISCSTSSFQETDLPRPELIDSLIYCITDSFDFTHKRGINQTKWTYAFFDSLEYLRVSTLAHFDSLETVDNYFFIDFLKNEEFKINDVAVFNAIDSAFICYQIQMKRNYNFNKKLFTGIQFVNVDDVKKERNNYIKYKGKLSVDSVFRWAKFYTPLLSYNMKYAIMQVCVKSIDKSIEFGDLFILQRSKNKWVILKSIRLYQI